MADDLRDAMTATSVNVRGMAEMLAVDERTVRRYLDGTRPIPGPVHQLLKLIRIYPQMSFHLRQSELTKGAPGNARRI